MTKVKYSKELWQTNPERLNLDSRIKFLRRGSIVGIIMELVFLTGGDLKNAQPLTISVDASVLVCFLVLIILSYHVQKYALLFNAAMLNVVVGSTVAMFTKSAPRAVFLMAVIPIMGYLLLRRKGGVLWSAILIFVIGILFGLSKSGAANIYVEQRTLVFAAISCIIIAILLYIYEGVNIVNENIIVDRNKEVTIANNRLHEELENNIKNSNDLKDALETAKKSNQQLQDSKLALLNVLDDANNLQTELRIQKESVEATVAERTKQLRNEQARLNASINSIDNGFLMTFVDEEKITYNPAIMTIFGLDSSFEKEAKKGALEAIDAVQTTIGGAFNIKEAIKKCIKSGTAFNVTDVAVKDKYIHIYGTPIVNEQDNTTIGTVILVQDRTEARVLERSKDEFMSIASHELRTPLTAIRGNASMLTMLYGDKMPDEDARKMVSDIKDSSVRLISIVNQFLATSRLEQKRTVFDNKPVDIKKCITLCTDELKGLLDEKKLKLTIDLPDKLPQVLADEIRTQEIITNVLGNAIKYTDKGSIVIAAKAAKDFVEVSITDTGKGMDPKNHDLLFHKFQQASSDILTRDDSRSTGLGLYITKQLVEQMGGSIYLDKSTLGKGSTFTFTLPVVDSKEYNKIRNKAKNGGSLNVS